jgi:hypothetical protein
MTMRDKISRLKADAERWCREHSNLQKELEAAHKRIAALEAERDRLDDGIEIAFGIIANAGGGNWTLESVEWQEAAARWRDAFYGPHCAAARAKEEKP